MERLISVMVQDFAGSGNSPLNLTHIGWVED